MRKVLYIDMDDVMCDFTGSYRSYRHTHPHVAFPQSIPGFFVNLKPIEGAIEAVRKLRECGNFDVYVLTAPSTRNPLSYMEKRIWIENQFGYEFTHNLIICANKGLLRGDFLIDDNFEGKGQEHFSGELIHFGSNRFPTWERVLNMLVKN